MNKKTLKEKLLDFYFAIPIFCDGLLIVFILLIEYLGKIAMIRCGLPLIDILDSAREMSYLSSIVSTIVALAGFMVAALTILITVKASLKARGFSDSENALVYIFTTDRYHEIVGVFMHSIKELIILLICCYIVWISAANINGLIISKFLFCVTFAIATSLIRSIYILFSVLKLENKKRVQGKVTESNDEKQTRLLEEILKQLSEKK